MKDFFNQKLSLGIGEFPSRRAPSATVPAKGALQNCGTPYSTRRAPTMPWRITPRATRYVTSR